MSPFLTQGEILSICIRLSKGMWVASGHSLSERTLESITSKKIFADAGRCSKINYMHGQETQKSMYSTELATLVYPAKDEGRGRVTWYSEKAPSSVPLSLALLSLAIPGGLDATGDLEVSASESGLLSLLLCTMGMIEAPPPLCKACSFLSEHLPMLQTYGRSLCACPGPCSSSSSGPHGE